MAANTARVGTLGYLNGLDHITLVSLSETTLVGLDLEYCESPFKSETGQVLPRRFICNSVLREYHYNAGGKSSTLPSIFTYYHI